MSYSTMKRSLEIELISAEGLKVNRKPVKKKTFCVVKIDEKSRISKLDESGGGSNPIWKDKMEMELPINGSVRFISIEVFYRTSGGKQKNVGYAKIPVKDFMGDFAPQGHLNFLSYRLRDEYGDKCGILNVSIMVKPDGPKPLQADKALNASLQEDSRTYQSSSSLVDHAECSSQTTNGQMWRGKTSSSMAVTPGYGGRVVTGVPVWSAFQRPSS